MESMATEPMYDIFLSHSSRDKVIVRGIADRLKADGLRVWFDEWEITPGANIPTKIDEGVRHSRVLLLCISKNGFGSDWVNLEQSAFRYLDPLNRNGRLIPLRLDETPIEGLLGPLHSISWLPNDREQSYKQLLEACRQAGDPPVESAQLVNDKCPLCGRVPPGRTFQCRVCNKVGICIIHFDGDEDCCTRCAATMSWDREAGTWRGVARERPWEVAGIGMLLQWVAKGHFIMGDTDPAPGRSHPQRDVRIPHDFWLGSYVVTEQEYREVMGERPSVSKADRCPVVGVNWDDANRFCERLTKREQREEHLPDGYIFRLPTEAEWEYAAKGGRKGRGHQYAGSAVLAEVGWCRLDGIDGPQVVGKKRANELEICDMCGNVWEWCLDGWHNDYINAPSDGRRWWGATDDRRRVCRGGSWRDQPDACTITYRARFLSDFRSPLIGFRCCLGLPAS